VLTNPSQKPFRRKRAKESGNLLWNLGSDSIKRIEYLATHVRNPGELTPPILDGRIVIAELLNAFPDFVFPSPSHLNGSIRYGIRPLLYSILRHEMFHLHDTGICANDQCRAFFEVERAGQQFCDIDCSRQQRQRDYWKARGKKLRAKRLNRRKRQASGH
jgi:hypothetical protein